MTRCGKLSFALVGKGVDYKLSYGLIRYVGVGYGLDSMVRFDNVFSSAHSVMARSSMAS